MIDQTTLRAVVGDLASKDKVVNAHVVSHDGLVLTSSTNDVDVTDIVGAMSSELIAKGKQSVRELELGELWGNMLFGTTGATLTRIINEEMVLLVRVEPGINIGAIVADMNSVVKKLSFD